MKSYRTSGAISLLSLVVLFGCKPKPSEPVAPRAGTANMTPEPPIGGMGSLGDSLVSLPLDAPVASARCTSDPAATVSWSVMNHVWTGGSAASITVKYTAHRAIGFRDDAGAELLVGKGVIRLPATGAERLTQESSGTSSEEQRYRIDRANLARLNRAKTVRVRLSGTNGRCEFPLSASAKARLAYFGKHALGL
jgi:hypothetical protein